MRQRGAAFLAVLVVTIAGWSVDAAPVGDAPLPDPPVEVRGAIATFRTTTLPTTTLLATTLPPTAPEVNENAVAAEFTASINRLRSSEGVSRLNRDVDLDSLAQSWAETVAADATLRHSNLIYEVIEGAWVAAGENLASGPTSDAMFAGLRASPPHLENIINADYSHLGVGVVLDGPKIWTVHLFAG